MLHRRIKASGIHLLVSATVAVVAAFLVFGVWYPPPYAELAGGWDLFFLVLSCDVVLGPVLTGVVASPGKPFEELRRDIAIIAVVQALALAYGLSTLVAARPAYTVFEVDRLRAVSVSDVEPDAWQTAAEPYRSPPWTGPRLIGARRATTPDEVLKSVELSFKGIELGLRPDRWADYAEFRSEVIARSKPASALIARYPALEADVRAAAARAGIAPDQVRFLPIVARQAAGIALVSGQDAAVLGYAKGDPFF